MQGRRISHHVQPSALRTLPYRHVERVGVGIFCFTVVMWLPVAFLIVTVAVACRIYMWLGERCLISGKGNVHVRSPQLNTKMFPFYGQLRAKGTPCYSS
jgi:hypothetical protein